MHKHFEILFLEEAFEFLGGLERKHYEKILYNIRKSQVGLDPELFKKISDDIWEFRTLYQGVHYRLLAFWDKTSISDTLVISTMDLSKKEIRYRASKFKKQLTLGQNIWQINKLKTRKNEILYFRPGARQTNW